MDKCINNVCLKEKFNFDKVSMARFLDTLRYNEHGFAIGSNYVDLIMFGENYDKAIQYAFPRIKSHINLVSYSNLYTASFLDLLFNPENIQRQDQWFNETDHMIMVPIILDDKFTLGFGVDKSSTTAVNIFDTIIFDVIIKPDNYELLREIYAEWLNTHQASLIENICKYLSSQQYVSIHDLTYTCKSTKRKIIFIRDDIYNWYNKFGYTDDIIKVSVLDQSANNAWIDIKCKIDVKVDRSIENLITYITNQIGPPVINYDILIDYKFITNTNNKYLDKIILKNKKYYEEKFKHKFKNFIIRSVSNLDNIVSVTIEYQMRNYKIDIIPYTSVWLDMLRSNQACDLIKLYLTDSLTNIIYATTNYNNITIKHTYKTDLFYLISIN